MQLETNGVAWLQASLPVKFCGLGVHRAEEVAPSAFLASIHAISLLTQSITSLYCLLELHKKLFPCGP